MKVSFPVSSQSILKRLSRNFETIIIYTRRQINLYRMFFVDISVNSQPILMKFCKEYFLVRRRPP